MKLKHHLIRHYQRAKTVPLWKWLVIIFLIIAMPLFFALINSVQTQQVISETNT